ncbi:hypothetical protein QEN19_003053 [Hanseniaspora menglaensis]
MFKQISFTLNNGNKIIAPSSMGIGSVYFKMEMQSTPENYNETLKSNLVELFEKAKGTVHIDCAANYNVYPEFSDALKINTQKTFKKREDLWITDKFDSVLGTFPDPKTHVLTVLKQLDLQYLDLFLIHYPFVGSKKISLSIAEIWAEMEQLLKDGKVRNIGVSNFSVTDLEKLNETAIIKPVINQIEWSPYYLNQSPGIYDYCQENKILIEAYSPLSPLSMKDAGEDDSEEGKKFISYIDFLAAKYSISDSEILLRYAIQSNVLPITTSSKMERILNNHNFTNDRPDLNLDDCEIAKITTLGKQHKQISKYEKFAAFFQTLIEK